MFKRSIKLFLLTCIIGLSSLMNVNAGTLYDKISPGDVIIGNTVFRGNTWISANRAAEAGSLYTLNTGEVNKNTYLYDDLEDWYKYNNNTEKYDLLSAGEISDLEEKINIYYENNKPLVNTYESYVEYEYDEEYDEEYISDANDVYWFYNEMYGEVFLENETDENVKLDYENETITCPYHYVFDFQVVENDEPINYKGICGIEDFEMVLEDDYTPEEISIESIELTSKQDNPNLLNQDKVEFNYNNINILEELEDITYEIDNDNHYAAEIQGKYIAFDIHFAEKNNVHNYRFLDRDYVEEGSYFIEYIDDNTIRLFLKINNYGYTSLSLLILDYGFSKFESLYFGSNGLEIPTYDFTLESIVESDYAYDQEMENNNDSIHSIEIISSEEEHFDTIRVDTIGELSNSSFNDYPAKWFAVDLFFNEEVDYDYLDITFNGSYDANYDYEFLEDRLRFYVAYDETTWLPITIRDERTNQSLFYRIVINNYAEENYIVANNGFLGSYTHSSEGIEKVDTNYSSFYALFYDSENSKLYYSNPYDLLFMDNDSLKMITTKTNDDIEEVVIENIDVMVVYNNGEQETWSSPTNLNNTTLYDSIINEIDENSELEVTIYTFFKPGKELTEAEQAELDKFDALVEAGTVEIVDISSSIYE